MKFGFDGSRRKEHHKSKLCAAAIHLFVDEVDAEAFP
jgi:hypothetical protein